MSEEELKSLIMQAQLQKNSCKILHDSAKGGVKSIEVKAYGRTDNHSDEAVICAISMLTDAIKRLQDEGFSIQK